MTATGTGKRRRRVQVVVRQLHLAVGVEKPGSPDMTMVKGQHSIALQHAVCEGAHLRQKVQPQHAPAVTHTLCRHV